MRQSAILASIAVLALVGCGGGSSQHDAAAQDGGNRPVGSPCDRNGDCKSVQCLSDPILLGLIGRDGGASTYGGYCFLFPCSDDAQCGDGAHCFDGTPFGAPTSFCLRVCQTPADCKDLQGQPRPNYECIQDVVPDSGATPLSGCVPGGLIQFDGGVQDDAAAQTD